MERWMNRAGKWALKEMIPVIFGAACVLAKAMPIFPDGNFKADAVLYLLFFGLLYFAWDFAR